MLDKYVVFLRENVYLMLKIVDLLAVIESDCLDELSNVTILLVYVLTEILNNKNTHPNKFNDHFLPLNLSLSLSLSLILSKKNLLYSLLAAIQPSQWISWDHLINVLLLLSESYSHLPVLSATVIISPKTQVTPQNPYPHCSKAWWSNPSDTRRIPYQLRYPQITSPVYHL